MRGALGIVEVESLLSVVERDTATLDRAGRATCLGQPWSGSWPCSRYRVAIAARYDGGRAPAGRGSGGGRPVQRGSEAEDRSRGTLTRVPPVSSRERPR